MGPNDLCIVDPNASSMVYGTFSQCDRGLCASDTDNGRLAVMLTVGFYRREAALFVALVEHALYGQVFCILFSLLTYPEILITFVGFYLKVYFSLYYYPAVEQTYDMYQRRRKPHLLWHKRKSINEADPVQCTIRCDRFNHSTAGRTLEEHLKLGFK
jgi:hypothetical protein